MGRVSDCLTSSAVRRSGPDELVHAVLDQVLVDRLRRPYERTAGCYRSCMVAELTHLRLPAFKSVRDAEIPLGPLTLVAGRNGSGKSNILDALTVLSALAPGLTLREALDGGREGPSVRGGSAGCAPLGATSFEVGCTARWENEGVPIDLHLDVVIRTEPMLQIESERLWTTRTGGPKRGQPLEYVKSDPANPESGDITARWENGKRGLNPPVVMRADQLLTSQVAARVPATSVAGRGVHAAAEAMLDALRGIFLLDPVPSQMREYVPAKDDRLRRNAENLSAAFARLSEDAMVGEELLTMTQSLSEAQVSQMTTVSSELGDVMVTMAERIGGQVRQVPARLMSDGTLRFLAIAAALLDTGEADTATPGRLLVVEEIENGLHPSQARLLVNRLKAAAGDRAVRTLATTHSPAVLDALAGVDHEFVAVCARDEEGWSTVTRLVDFPDYIEVAGRASLGEMAVRDRLRPGDVDEGAVDRALAEIF